jgi:hypothetical protein
MGREKDLSYIAWCRGLFLDFDISLLYLILVYSAKACYLRFLTLLLTNIGVNLTEFHINLSVNVQLFYVNVMRFSGVTCCFLQVKSENLYISDVRTTLGSELRVRDSASLVPDPKFWPPGGIYISHIDTNEEFSYSMYNYAETWILDLCC